MSLAVDKNSVYLISKQDSAVAFETSLRHYLKKLKMDKLIRSNENILLQNPLKMLKTSKCYEFAVDLTNDPYYERTDLSNEKYVICNRLKNQQTLLLIHFPLHH